MGGLLREALRMLCGMNQWSYGVFWKIGNQNSKLLIWEECYYDTPASQLGYQSWDRLIEKMMINNQINLVGQGLVGRAAFIGSHQWILANSFTRDSNPPEVLNEVHLQFSAGMQTVAVIPVLPHGVIQLGSCLPIMENVGFINDVKNLIHQLGCIPGALFSNSYGTNDFSERIGIPISVGTPVSVGPSGVFRAANSSPFGSNSCNQPSNPREASSLLGTSSSPVNQIKNRQQANASASQLPTFHENNCEPKFIPGCELPAVHGAKKAIEQPIFSDDDWCVNTSSGDDLFDVLGADLKKTLLNGKWNNVRADSQNVNTEKLCNAFSANEGLLDAVVSSSNSASKQISDDDRSCMSTTTKISDPSITTSSPIYSQVNIPVQRQLLGLQSLTEAGLPRSSSNQSSSSKDDTGTYSQTTSIYGSQISSLAETIQNSVRDAKKNDGITKPNRKRLKSEDNPRPRPKDRQLIQDRLKEIREVIPNGAKCSIDALLEKTIKHMIFLQSVAKHGDKLKHTGEPKIVNKNGGVILKDNFDGGATWAFEVGSQSMVCPIIVEDLNSPRQMLIEMMCEERGYFLEIADLIRGMGLTILKGVMERRNDKIWARFAVEANRDVTRMEIFMSLVRLLDQTANHNETTFEANTAMLEGTSIPATGYVNSLR